MAWYDDIWSGIKSVVSVGKDIVSTVAPILPLLLKKGGSLSEFRDTPANRKKIINAWNKLHPDRKITEGKLKKHMLKKGVVMKKK